MNNIYKRPAWVEVNLDNFINNMTVIKNTLSPGTEILSVVKADGYKIGAVTLVREAIKLGIKNFAVATESEAMLLRKEFKDINILKLGYTPNYQIEESIDNNISSTIYTLEQAKTFNEIAKKLNKKAKIHISIDTGMSRIGFQPNDDSIEKIVEIFKLKNLEIKGVFSHFASADYDKNFTKKQFDTFTNFIDELESRGCHFEYRHIANSASILCHREYNLDLVRPGIIQFGYTDTDKPAEFYNLKPLVSVKAEISNVKYIEKDVSVGYSRTYFTNKKTKVVTLPIGYADGFPRILSGKIDILINGVKCPQIGLICMDQLMVDTTGVECEIGDTAVLIGKQKNEEIRICDFCEISGDCETSFLTHLDKRLPRIYYKDGKVVDILEI